MEPCRLVNLNDGAWFLDEREVLKGNRLKYSATAIREAASPVADQVRWIWKTSKPIYPLEFWSEVLAAHIGAAIGIPVPEAFPAQYDGMYGALMANFVDRLGGELLWHGGDILLNIKRDYEREKGRDHSVQLILKGLRFFNKKTKLYGALFDQWLFDAVIGNQDRHQDNWGIVAYPVPPAPFSYDLRLAPAFDNGSSMGRELEEDRIRQLLANPDQLKRYITRGKAHVRWQEGDVLFDLTHEELLHRHFELFPKSRTAARSFFRFDLGLVEAAIRHVCDCSRAVPELSLSDDRENFLVLVTRRRVERLRRVLGL